MIVIRFQRCKSIFTIISGRNSMYEARGEFKRVASNDVGKTGQICRWFLENVSIPTRHKHKVIRIFNNMESSEDREDLMDDIYGTVQVLSLPRNAMGILINRYSDYLTPKEEVSKCKNCLHCCKNKPNL